MCVMSNEGFFKQPFYLLLKIKLNNKNTNRWYLLFLKIFIHAIVKNSIMYVKTHLKNVHILNPILSKRKLFTAWLYY